TSKMEGNSPEMAQMTQLMTMMYGPNGMSGVIGALDDKTTLIASGLSDDMIKNVITAAKANQDKLSAGDQVKMVAAQLPANRTAVAYIAVDEIVTAAVSVAQQMHLPVNMQLSTD